MSDRELLELAAKAAKKQFHWDGNVQVLDSPEPNECSAWYPLEDDGDALRLAMRLNISIHFNIVYVGVDTINLTLNGIFIKEDTLIQDCDAATRRAIVRAAAAIGRTM